MTSLRRSYSKVKFRYEFCRPVYHCLQYWPITVNMAQATKRGYHTDLDLASRSATPAICGAPPSVYLYLWSGRDWTTISISKISKYLTATRPQRRRGPTLVYAQSVWEFAVKGYFQARGEGEGFCNISPKWTTQKSPEDVRNIDNWSNNFDESLSFRYW